MTENLTRAEARTRSAHLNVESYNVVLDITDEGELFDTRSTIVFTSTTDATFIDFIGESVSEVIVNGTQIDVEYDGARIPVSGLTERNEVTIVGRGRYSNSGEGLHKFVDPVDNSRYLYTQYEPAEARRVFANFEQPDLKAVFTFTVTGPKDWKILSNREVASRTENGESVTVTFEPTLTMSTYLTALVAGPYYEVRSEEDPRFGIFCRQSLAEHLDAEEIFEVSLQGLELFEKAFDYPYPWGKYDSAFVPEYNLGAMENPGLVTFTEAYIFRGESTRAQHSGRANTILHEMSHMWFGDLVTPQWWDDLWLKESFAEFMGAWGIVNATKFTEGWVSFLGGRTNWAFYADNLPTTHPIQADIPDLEAADQNFDGITYAKGAAVLRQLVTYVGEDKFFAGVQNYFAKHEYSNTQLSDLLVELEATSGRDLGAWVEQWLHTSGASVLSLRDGVLVQEGQDPKTGKAHVRPHRLSVGAYSVDGNELVRTDSVMVEIETEAPVDLVGDAIIPNDEGQTYAITRLDPASAEQVLRYRVSDPLARAVAWMGLWQAVRDGELNPLDYVNGVARQSDESDSALLAAMIRNCEYIVEHYVADVDAAREQWFTIASEALDKASGDGEYLWRNALARAAAAYPAGQSRIEELLETVTDKDQRWLLLEALAATDAIGVDALDTELGSSPTEADIVAHMAATSSIPSKRQAAHDRALSENLSNDRLSALLHGATARYNPETYPFFEIANTLWDERSQEIATRILHALFPQTDEAIENGHTWLAGDGAEAPGALRKIIIDGVDMRERDKRVREKVWN